MNKLLISLIIIIGIVIGGAFLYDSRNGTEVENREPTPKAMLAEKNAVVVNDQKPGTSIVGSIVYLENSGFLVIHEDMNGAPGRILGASALLPSGENENIRVTLAKQVKDGETLHAMLHADSDGDGKFQASTDTPVQSMIGGPIHGTFRISTQAQENIPVSL